MLENDENFIEKLRRQENDVLNSADLDIYEVAQILYAKKK